MANVTAVLNDQIRRLAAREIRARTKTGRRLTAQHRRDIAALKRQVAALEKAMSFLEAQEKRRVAQRPLPQDMGEIRFRADGLKSHRSKLGLSAKDYGRIIGVAGLTVYSWEAGKSRPRKAQLAKLAAVRGLGKREAIKRLELLGQQAAVLGSHLSIAGGMHNALLEAERLGMATVQVFTKNQQQWNARPLEAEPTALWETHRQRLGFARTVSHDSYLINLASPDKILRDKSIAAFIEELRRCQQLNIPYLVTHPGAHVGDGEARGLRRVAASLNEVHRRVGAGVITCLEITAGQGSSLGWRLEHLARIIELTKSPDRLGVCLDTAHLFAAGYDFRGRKYAAFRRQVEATVGIGRVKVLHLNDSKKELGSRVDRHEHIGRGFIGLDGFRPFMRDSAFRDVPKILETPKGPGPDGRSWDAINLAALQESVD